MKEEKIDLKKTVLLFRKKIGQILGCVVATALLFAGVYLLQRAIFHSEKIYQASSDYYITFDLDRYPNGVDYYNAYTWDSILRDDPIIDTVMKNLPDSYTKDQVKPMISGEMLGDYRILSVYVTGEQPESVEDIAEALDTALQRFPERIDMIVSIEPWSTEPCKLLKADNKAGNAAVLGAIVGLVVSGFAFAFWCILDDGVYTEKDCSLPVPFLGFMTRKNSEFCRKELSLNLLEFLEQDKKYSLTVINRNSILPGNVYETLKAMCPLIGDCLSLTEENMPELKKSAGIILMAPWGKKNIRVLEKTVVFLEKQKCRPAGVIFYDAEDEFLQKYYGVR